MTRVPAATYRLPRTGDAPLVFEGEILAEASGYRFAGREQTRWHEIAVYRTRMGRYVLAITLVTQWQGETDQHDVRVAADVAALVGLLRAHDPAERYARREAGYPPGDHYDGKQARLVASLRERWTELLTGVLEQLGVEERIG